MVTFFLLTLLGGAVAALVVADSESDKRATDRPLRHRGGPRHALPRSAAPRRLGHGLRSPGPRQTTPRVALPSPSDERPPEGSGRRLVARPVDHDLDPRTVPRRYVALDGTYAQVARVPLWRRLLSFTLLAAFTVAGGAVAAAVLGGTVAVLGELVDRTIQ